MAPGSADPSGRSKTILVVERALDVLSHIASRDERTVGVTEISDALGLSKAVVHRILTTLRASGYVDIDPSTRRYALGVQSLQIGLAYLDRMDVLDAARPVMEDLSRRTAETVTLSLRTGNHRTYIEQVVPDRDVRMEIKLGLPMPLFAGASSKAFLAAMSSDEVDAFLAEVTLESLTDHTITSGKALRAELDDTRARGYARSLGERMSGAAAVAAPILGRSGHAVAVISVCGPRERFEPVMDAAAEELVYAATGLSARMGYCH